MKRKFISKKRSKRQFTQGAVKTHRKNLAPNPMRGGIRL